MKIAFHDNIISQQGTSIVIFDHAYYTRKFLNYDPIIMYNLNYSKNDIDAINKFKNEFEVYGYNDISEIDKILNSNKCEVFFMIKGGKWDGIISNTCKNWINAVSPCTLNDIHGDSYAMGSKWLSKLTDWKIPCVPHMVNLPDIHEDMREYLNISKDDIVIGCHGAEDCFDIDFSKDALIEYLNLNTNAWFVSLFTNIGIQHERIIRLERSSDLINKVKFINTCDIMLHARYSGESFGLSCAEFSTRNKPVITYANSNGRNHIETLGEKAFLYTNKDDLLDILKNLNKKELNSKDWNAYSEYTPENVIKQFNEIYKL